MMDIIKVLSEEVLRTFGRVSDKRLVQLIRAR
jgi:hypothetical protein